MNTIKKLKLEYQGIRNTILDYTDDGNIVNFLDGLKANLDKEDMESIIYFVEQINIWYTNNLHQIHQNEYVFNSPEHDRNKKLLSSIYEELVNNLQVEKKEDEMYSKILLSHSSKNIKYGHAIRDLLMDIGLRKEQLIYTSHALHKIPEGERIFDYLKQNMQKHILVIYLISNEYMESAACLNEMGAAWIIENDYVSMYTPDFDFNNSQYHNCAIDTKKMGIVLKNDNQCKMGMVELKEKLINKFGLTIDEKEWIYSLDKFMEKIG